MSNTKKRLVDFTAEDIRALYKKHDLVPNNGHCAVFLGKCCALGVLMVENGSPFGSKSATGYVECLDNVVDGDELEAAEFARGFDAGFSDKPGYSSGGPRFPQQRYQDAFSNGFEIGKALAPQEQT